MKILKNFKIQHSTQLQSNFFHFLNILLIKTNSTELYLVKALVAI